jgi:hypothetical protein
MTKRIVIGLVMVLALSTSLFAQQPIKVNFDYVGNLTAEEFKKLGSGFITEHRVKVTAEIFNAASTAITLFPNSVTQAINADIAQYSCRIGDIFIGSYYIYAGGDLHNSYQVVLRITAVNGKNFTYDFYAFKVVYQY